MFSIENFILTEIAISVTISAIAGTFHSFNLEGYRRLRLNFEQLKGHYITYGRWLIETYEISLLLSAVGIIVLLSSILFALIFYVSHLFITAALLWGASFSGLILSFAPPVWFTFKEKTILNNLKIH